MKKHIAENEEKTIYAFMNAYSSGKSGGDVAFISLMKKIRNFKIVVITSQKGSKLCRKLGLRSDFIITGRENNSRNLFFTYLTRTINACVRIKEGADILYASSDFFPDVVPAFFLKNYNSKWIQVINHVYPHYHARPGKKFINMLAYYLQRLSFSLIKKKADQIIVLNPYTKKQLIGLGFDKDKIHICYSGINMGEIKNIKPAEKSYEAVFLGRLNYSKGIFDLIDIWKRVCQKIPKAKLAIIGDGENGIKREIYKKIEVLGLKNNVDCLGHLPDRETLSIRKAGKIFVFPSREEGFSLAVTEAMACGIPVITWDLPVYKTIFDDHLIQIPQKNINLFAKNIIVLLQNKNQGKSLALRAKNFVKKYDWEKIFPFYFAVLIDEKT